MVFDPKTDGLAVLVLPTGRKSFVFDYYTRGGQRRRVTIGQVGPWTVKAAQAEARRLRVDTDRGGDPQGERQAERQAATVNELADMLEREHLQRKRASTVKSYVSILKTIRGELGTRKVADVSHVTLTACTAS